MNPKSLLLDAGGGDNGLRRLKSMGRPKVTGVGIVVGKAVDLGTVLVVNEYALWVHII